MGDRTTVRLEIGGSVTQAEWLELLKLLEDEGASDNYTWDPVRSDDPPVLIEETTFTVLFEECNYGQAPDEIVDWLLQHNLPFEHSWEAGGGYGPGAKIHRPRKPVIEYATVDWEPALTVAEIKRHLEAGTLEDHIELLETKIPPFKVTE